MPLATGSRLGPYEILAPIGAGGMGEVYRARDAKLGRDVALKVLPEAFAHDAERMARFQREAKVLASLNHPNIATIHGLEDSGSTHALVMELVEGPTLADRIKSGTIPIDEVLRIAKQITEALEYAHERGIVHRDLKPANVKVTSDDAVKVLDFGLAKAIEGEATDVDLINSPTMSRMATLAGVLLGTAAYMSPEQAKGKPVDRRADIWAFGCVLYEMLTGQMAFRGESVTDTLAAVIRAEPDWSPLPAATPIRVRVLLQRCLQKDPKQRLRDIGDARIALDEVIAGAPEQFSLAAPAGQARRWRWLSLAMGFVIVAAAAGFAGWSLRPLPAKSVTRTVITLPSGQRLAGAGQGLEQPVLAISADGSELAYVATTQGGGAQKQIYLRPMNSVEARPIAGTEGADDPFFSPDGQWLGFVAGGTLRKVPVNGGVAQDFGGSGITQGASWGSGGMIVFADILSVLEQVPESGGVPRPLSRFQSGEPGHYWPEFLPGSKSVIFVSASLPPSIAVLPMGTGEWRPLIQGQPATMPQYAPSGHLVYAQAGNLMAVPFDPQRLQVTGDAVPVVHGVLQTSGLVGVAQFRISQAGSLVYVPGDVSGLENKLVWVLRNGKEQPLAAPAGDYDQPRLSPDGRRAAVNIRDRTGTEQIALYDLARDTISRFTFDGTVNQYPTWTPDGKKIAFMSNKQGGLDIFWQRADGGGDLERLTTGNTSVPFSWSPDGQLLAGVEVSPPSPPEIMTLRLSDRKTQPFLQTHTGTFEDAPQLSPDGKWLAYASDESGRREIYVQPYPTPGGKWQISTDGGNEPQWNRNGRELFYRDGDKMMVVDIGTQSGFAVGKPRLLFEGHYLKNVAGYARANYDVSPDGQRFLMIKPVEQEQAAPTQINVVLNWTEELKRLVPVYKK